MRLWAAMAGLCLASACAASVAYKSQTSVMPSLTVGVGPRAEGMGGAFTALADDAFALAWNPAGLAKPSQSVIAFSHNEWNGAMGMRQEYLAWAGSVGSGGLGASVNYFSLGELELRDSTGALTGRDSGSDLSASVGYAINLGYSGLSLGLALEGYREQLPKIRSTGLGGSLGARYRRGDLSLGAAILHASNGGPAMQGALGACYRLAHDNLRFSADYSLPLNQDAAMLKAGVEGRPLSTLWLRAGWRQVLGDSPIKDPRSGFSAGFGVELERLTIDYAYVPMGDFAPAHRVAASLRFKA